MKNKAYWIGQPKSFNKYYFSSNNLNLLSKFLHIRMSAVLSLINPSANKSLLDVGCGSGMYLAATIPKFKNVVGMDISEAMLDDARKKLIAFAKNRYKIYLGDAEKRFPFKPNSFDIVLSIGLLDYANPKNVLLECKRVLSKNGFIVFTIPKKPSMFFFLRSAYGNFIRRKLLGLPPLENVVDKKSLYCLIDECGFEPLLVKSVWTTMWIVKAKK